MVQDQGMILMLRGLGIVYSDPRSLRGNGYLLIPLNRYSFLYTLADTTIEED